MGLGRPPPVPGYVRFDCRRGLCPRACRRIKEIRAVIDRAYSQEAVVETTFVQSPQILCGYSICAEETDVEQPIQFSPDQSGP